MSKIDFKKTLKHLYNPPKEFILVDVPEMQFLQVDGRGDPNKAQEYQDAVEALYAVAYKIKFSSKNELGKDFVVPPLEGLWWSEDMASFTHSLDKDKWEWRMMIMTPEWISDEIVKNARPLQWFTRVRILPPWRKFVWKPITKAYLYRSCTSAPMMTRLQPCTSSITNTCLRMVS